MKTLKLCPILLSVALIGCNTPSQVTSEPSVIAIEQNIQNETVLAKATNTKANSNSTVKKNTVKKATPTVPQVPTVNKTTVKDVIIDGTGSLVFAKADGTFLSFAPVQGQKGDQGVKGDKGDRGADGKDGRGIDHLKLDSDNNLIAYYTDGTVQNVCNLASLIPTESSTSSDNDFIFNNYGNGTELIFYNGNSSNVVIPSKCTKIDDYVFSGKTFITSVTIPDSVSTIGRHAFECCNNLASVTIPNSVMLIDDFAFVDCSSLASVTYKGQTYSNSNSLIDALRANNVYVASDAFIYSF